MAGSVSITYQFHRSVKKVIVDWISDASGDVNGFHTTYLSGEILRVACIPGARTPSNLYDVVLEGDHGMDLLQGKGQDLSNSESIDICPGIPVVYDSTTELRPVAIDDTVELKISNAGNTKNGTVVIFYR